MDTRKFVLGSKLSKSSKNENISINIELTGNKKILPDNSVDKNINPYDVYLDERNKSNKFRLILNISPYCSNVLFNPFTEIVKYYFDDDTEKYKVFCLNFDSNTTETLETHGIIDEDSVIGKSSTFEWTAIDAIRDTQFSNEKCGFIYYCGIDIFNNHIVRNKTFKSVNYTSKSEKPIANLSEVYGTSYKNINVNNENTDKYVYSIEEDFNTIDDYLRDRYGVIVTDSLSLFINGSAAASNQSSKDYNVPLHLYQACDVYSFKECINDKLVEKDGWFGVYNEANIVSPSLESDDDNSSNDSNFTPSDNTETNNDTGGRIGGLRSVDESSESCDCENLNISENSECDCDNLNIYDNLECDCDLLEIFDSYRGSYEAKDNSINKLINNKKYNEFIDMYPTRELFTFSPTYNKYRERLEKNWNYCLTYPSKSITKMIDGTEFPFFDYENKLIALKALMFDEYVVGDDGRLLVTVYSICQHGLKMGDYVNIYKGNELFYESEKVIRVIDKYIFQIYKTSANISEKWIDLSIYDFDDTSESTTDAINFTSTNNRAVSESNCDCNKLEIYRSPSGDNEYIRDGNYLRDKNGNLYPIVLATNRCNVDENAQNISFKRVVNNVECEYYVRMFSRLPNFKFVDQEVNDFTLYGNNTNDLINRFSDPEDPRSEFENHASDASFAQTAYGDMNTEIVYTDDIDVSYLRDNLGRPISDIFFTVVKNNTGYKEWYGINTFQNVSDEIIEQSHCFGRNSSSFLLSDEYREIVGNKGTLFDVRDINTRNKSGLKYNSNGDEIVFNEFRDFYGDICCYSPIDCDEESIQSVHNRFNTVQREYKDYGKSSVPFGKNKDGRLYFDEIKNDEYNMFLDTDEDNTNGEADFWRSFNDDSYRPKRVHSSYHSSNPQEDSFNGLLEQREGYYYKSHYKIRLKNVSETLSIKEPLVYELYDMVYNGKALMIKTIEEHGFSINQKLILYSKHTNEFFYLTVNEIFTTKYFSCTLLNEEYNSIFNDNDIKLENYSLLARDVTIPDYARIIKDSSCRFYWRDIVANGIESTDKKVYPFTNGAFYVDRQINFFLRRQDPFKEKYDNYSADFDYTYEGEITGVYDVYDTDPYYEAEEIEQC